MKTILLIDDEEGVRTTFGQVPRRSGYHGIEADKLADLSRMVEELVDNACKYSRRGKPH